MLRNKFCEIFHKVQQTVSCHQKYRQIFIKLYNETNFDDFEAEFMRCLERLLTQEMQPKNVYADRSLEFAATFVTGVAQTAEKQIDSNDSDEESEMHPFLEAVINNVLRYHNLDYVSLRYRSCQFINLILRNLGDDAHIDVDVGNAIQVAMLERLEDIKPFIRLQAVKAVARLQQPENSECLVMRALLSHMYESSAVVRKEIVDVLAVTPPIVTRIVERVRDCDHLVRLAAFRKCSLLGPRLITIASRQLIIESGFNEQNENVRRCFLEDMLPKWLSAYNGNFLQLLQALKLDAYEEDLKKTETISKKVLEVYFRSQQLNAIVEYLPIDDTKLIPMEQLTTEAVLYWCILTSYLRKSENTEDYLEDVIPELVHFCAYIEKIFKELNSKSMQDWQYLEFQQIMCQLFQMVGEYDLSDEVGRKALHKLIVDMLTTGKFSNRVITEMISILAKINPIIDSLTCDICHILSDIREPLIEQAPSEEKIRQNEFRLAELRVRINILDEERNEAVTKSDYETAARAKRELIELNKKVEDIMMEFETAKTVVRTSQNDPETTCRCLDILIGMLSHPNLKTLTASLRSCKDEFVKPLMKNENNEISQRVFKCVALFCTLDQQITRENLQYIVSPIFLYHILPQHDKPIVLTSIAAISDILRLFGSEIFTNGNGGGDTSNNMSRRRFNGTRRLYTVAQMDDIESFDISSVVCEDVVDSLLDMLDDEGQEFREQAGRALCELVMSKIAVSPTLMSRMIVKWFNPMTEKHDQRLQQLLGNTFVYFAQCVEGSEEILEKSVIPVLNSIGNAPRTSPLADVDLDNALRFLAAITSVQKTSEFVNTHKNLAYALCYKVSAKPEDKCVPLYIKMLLQLELFLEDSVIIQELINQAELVLHDVTDKGPKRNVEKFVSKLRKLLIDIEAHKDKDDEPVEAVPIEEVQTVNNTEQESILRNSETERLINSVQVSLPPEPRNSSRTTLLQENITCKRNSLPEKSQISNGKICTQNGDAEDTNCVSNKRRRSEPLKKKVTKETKNHIEKFSKLSLSETPIIRRSQRSLKALPATPETEEEETILHTIIEDDEHQMEIIEDDDLTIQTPTTSTSSNSVCSSGKRGRSRRSNTSETSSDSEVPRKKTKRRSSRRKRSKNYKY